MEKSCPCDVGSLKITFKKLPRTYRLTIECSLTGYCSKIQAQLPRSTGPEVFYCEYCHVSSGSAISHQQHMQGSSHAKKVRQFQWTPSQGQTGVDNFANTPLRPQVFPMQPASSFKCGVCNVECSSQENLQQHMQSESHRRNAGLLTTSVMFVCDICQVTVCGRSNYEAHLSGSSHKKRLLQPDSGRQFYCELCNISVSGSANAQSHLNGIAHMKKLTALGMQFQTPLSSAPTPAAMPVMKEVNTGGMMVGNPGVMREITSSGMREISSGGMREITSGGMREVTTGVMREITSGGMREVHSGMTTPSSSLDPEDSPEANLVNDMVNLRLSSDPVLVSRLSVASLPDPATMVTTQKHLCEVCNITCDTEEVLQMHFNSNKHLRKLAADEESRRQQSQPFQSALLQDEAQFTEDFICGKCQTTFSELSKLLQHYETCTSQIIQRKKPISVVNPSSVTAQTPSPPPSYPASARSPIPEPVKTPLYQIAPPPPSPTPFQEFTKTQLPTEATSYTYPLEDGSFYCYACSRKLANEKLLKVHLMAISHKQNAQRMNVAVPVT